MVENRTRQRAGRGAATLLACLLLWPIVAGAAPPELTGPVTDLAGAIDPASAADIERLSRALQAETGDVVVVVTVDSVMPYSDIQEYAVELFENHGRGIGERGKDNGVLILLALRERAVRIEVGYGLEQWITDGFAGETSREVMVPEFRAGRYGPGLLAGTARIVARIAEGRNVTLADVPVPQPARATRTPEISLPLIVLIFIVIVLLSRSAGGPGGRFGPRRRSGWSGWSSGVGSFGGSWTSGGRSFGGFGGGFGGFGGGRSGGGGGGASW
jgi:uncharacterized protein